MRNGGVREWLWGGRWWGGGIVFFLRIVLMDKCRYWRPGRFFLDGRFRLFSGTFILGPAHKYGVLLELWFDLDLQKLNYLIFKNVFVTSPRIFGIDPECFFHTGCNLTTIKNYNKTTVYIPFLCPDNGPTRFSRNGSKMFRSTSRDHHPTQNFTPDRMEAP